MKHAVSEESVSARMILNVMFQWLGSLPIFLGRMVQVRKDTSLAYCSTYMAYKHGSWRQHVSKDAMGGGGVSPLMPLSYLALEAALLAVFFMAIRVNERRVELDVASDATTLTSRYQLSENVRTTRAVLQATIVLLLSYCPLVINYSLEWVGLYAKYVDDNSGDLAQQLRSELANCVLPVYGVAFSLFVLRCSSQLRQRMRDALPCCIGGKLFAPLTARQPRTGNAEDGRRHFDALKQAWA